MSSVRSLVVVAGGNGFIGSHVARRLHAEGYCVRIVDINPISEFTEPICDELIIGNLCDPAFCDRVVRGAHTIFHFAAAMGGMGTIHSPNDFIIYAENHTMTQNLLNSSLSEGVSRFFYASSACVYPESMQDDSAKDVSLREADAFVDPPPRPQGLYGLEKLVSEILIRQYDTAIDVRIARFHNIYGPRGAWRNGREKVPAALIRKTLSARFLGFPNPSIEIWGDGTQRRSFLFIDDCVDAILLLMADKDEDRRAAAQPVNIGSDYAVTVDELATIALQCVGVAGAQLIHQGSRPTGVSARNSNNELVERRLLWRPREDLANGMQRTAEWMEVEMEHSLDGLDDGQRASLLHSFQRSQLVDLRAEWTAFAILLPITSRGTADPEDCLKNLACFSRSLFETTWRDTHALGGTRFRVRVYLAIDKDDSFLLDGAAQEDKASDILRANGFPDITTLLCDFPRGYICDLWRTCVKRAWADGCDYFILMGDDVVLQDEGWMRHAVQEFRAISERESVPYGFGCVAFTDTSFPGMPTFPIIHRTHLDIFEGEVVPQVFINQDGDPYLYQLYRRWNCSTMFRARICNAVGGSEAARYEKKYTSGWTFETLDNGTGALERWLRTAAPAAQRRITLDIIVPSHRVQLGFLEPILSLQPSNGISVMFIIIIDNPTSPSLSELKQRFHHRPDVRIRVNKNNLGASASRNRGMFESSAEWVFFLDDDVSPEPDILLRAEEVIRTHPNAAGFVGNVHFPISQSVFTTAVHLAGVTYFWDIATKIEDDIPWGVTASLIARRNVPDDIQFDLRFPKTGGGEDIDFCRKKREFALSHGSEGFRAAPHVIATHPWWNNGRRSYWRFYGWSKGDARLIGLYPTLTYLDHAPSSAELFLMSGIVLGAGVTFASVKSDTRVFIVGFKMALSIFLANVVHDFYRHLWRDSARANAIQSSISGWRWPSAVLESSLIRMASEGGRVTGLLENGEVLYLGRRFDWFAQRWGNGPIDEERMNSRQRMALFIIVLALMIKY
ncbi:hypothetical protein EW146_g8857 [Bondarzewia mesenterica]|uniref:Glycosyltransferase 2-like domain-containing protein n=1 Tax=Bondarzewia mesenterica TaxID=1095465 RepID=A0A4S4LBC0_9AGAM|nr:hypothetical protein EW146_g8857 [Bondarzewia mesenterica]